MDHNLIAEIRSRKLRSLTDQEIANELKDQFDNDAITSGIAALRYMKVPSELNVDSASPATIPTSLQPVSNIEWLKISLYGLLNGFLVIVVTSQLVYVMLALAVSIVGLLLVPIIGFIFVPLAAIASAIFVYLVSKRLKPVLPVWLYVVSALFGQGISTIIGTYLEPATKRGFVGLPQYSLLICMLISAVATVLLVIWSRRKSSRGDLVNIYILCFIAFAFVLAGQKYVKYDANTYTPASVQAEFSTYVPMEWPAGWGRSYSCSIFSRRDLHYTDCDFNYGTKNFENVPTESAGNIIQFPYSHAIDPYLFIEGKCNLLFAKRLGEFRLPKRAGNIDDIESQGLTGPGLNNICLLLGQTKNGPVYIEKSIKFQDFTTGYYYAVINQTVVMLYLNQPDSTLELKQDILKFYDNLVPGKIENSL